MSSIANTDHHSKHLGMRIVTASSLEVVLEWTIGPEHRQPHGIVHGGVHCSAIETACSVGASISASEREAGWGAVGLENHTSFIRGAREGTLTATAKPLTRGRTTQVWECEIRDSEQRLVATGRMRLLCVKIDALP